MGSDKSNTPEIRKPVGRPSKLDPGTREKLEALIRGGALAQDAAAAVGIGKSTFYTWLAKGRAQRKGQYREFVDAIELAQSVRRSLLLGRVVGASNEKKHWQAAAWVLQHTDAALFSPKLRVHIETELRGALERLSQEFANEPDIYERILASIAGAAGVSGASGDPSAEGEGAGAQGALADSPPA